MVDPAINYAINFAILNSLNILQDMNFLNPL
jgi:hypothetical protein